MTSSLTSLVPIRWHAGPLETALHPDESEANAALLAPGALDALKESPFNAIVVQWSAGREQDAAQQKALTPLVAKARSLNIAVLGLVKNSAAAAGKAGLAGVIADSPVSDAADLPVIPANISDDDAPASGIVCAAKALWPRVPATMGRKGGESLGAGPTGAPWVDSNGWLAQLIQAKRPDTKLWLMPELPKGVTGLRPEHYELAVADAAAFGARCVLSFEPELRLGLARGNSASRDVFQAASNAVRSFEKLPGPKEPVVSRLAVVSDFVGQNRVLAGEILNLCARRHLPARAVSISKLSSEELRGITTILLVMTKLPAEAHDALASFLRQGGLAIAAASLAHMAHSPADGNFDQRYDLHSFGKGRYAIARKPWNDPYAIALDAHLLMSRKQDVVRLWNAGSTNIRYSASPSGTGYLQILNYTARAMGHPMSAWVAGIYTAATLSGLNRGSEPLTITQKNGGSEVALPPFPVYASIEFRG